MASLRKSFGKDLVVATIYVVWLKLVYFIVIGPIFKKNRFCIVKEVVILDLFDRLLSPTMRQFEWHRSP